MAWFTFGASAFFSLHNVISWSYQLENNFLENPTPFSTDKTNLINLFNFIIAILPIAIMILIPIFPFYRINKSLCCGWFFSITVLLFLTNSQPIIPNFVLLIASITLINRIYLKTNNKIKNTNTPNTKNFNLIKLLENPVITAEEKWNRLSDWAKIETSSIGIENDLLSARDYKNEIINILSNSKNYAIGIIGPFGCGKSTILDFTKNELNDNNQIILCPLNCWGFKNSQSIEKTILEVMIRYIDDHIERYKIPLDISDVKHLPKEWECFFESNTKLAPFKLLFQTQPPEHLLGLLNEKLKEANLRIVIILEDLDRNQAADYCPRQVQALLEQLKTYSQFSLVIAASLDPNSFSSEKQIDFARLCEHLLYPPYLQPALIEKVLYSALTYLGLQSAEWDETALNEFLLTWGFAQNRFQPSSSEPYIDFISPREIALLISTPRQLKHFIRHLQRGWNKLKGEICLFDFVLIIILRICIPDVFNFLLQYNELLRTELTDKNSGSETISMRQMQQEWEKIYLAIGSQKGVAQKILSFLYGNLEKSLNIKLKSLPKEHIYGRQRIRFGVPTDYWKRAIEEKIEDAENSDTTISTIHKEWIENKNSRLISLLALPEFSSKWFHLKFLTLANRQVMTILEDYIFCHGTNEDRPLDLYLPTDPSIFKLLKRLDSHIINDNALLERMKDLILKLMTKNFFIAYQLCERYLNAKALGTSFAEELKISIEHVLTQYKTASDLFAIIPGENKYNTLFQHFFSLIFPEKSLPQNLKLIFSECFDPAHTNHAFCIESLLRIACIWNSDFCTIDNQSYFLDMDFKKVEHFFDKSFTKRFALILYEFIPSDPRLLKDLNLIKEYALKYTQNNIT